MFSLTCYFVKDSVMKILIVENVTDIVDISINKSFEYHFKEVYVNSSRNLSLDILKMLLKDNVKSYKLDILFSNNHYIILVRLRENRCMFYQSCNNPFIAFIVFTEILIRIIANDFFISLIVCKKKYV